MSKNSNLEVDEISIKELIGGLWAHKILICLIAGLSIFVSGYYALTTDKKYTAKAVFQIDQENNSGFNISRELGAIASLAGLAGGASSSSGSAALVERAEGREFILKFSNNSSLYAETRDQHLSTYIPEYKDPLWKAIIKDIVGWEKTELEQKSIVENKVIQNFRKFVEFEETDGGAIVILVTHTIPKKASEYANALMEEMRLLVENESTTAKNLRLTYLSETLADALQDMDKAQQNLKDYALKNSAMAQENFISGSLKLDEIRMEKRKVAEIANLLSILEKLVKSGNLDRNSYDALRSNNPLVDDIDFRRILGMSETISAWTWPEIDTIEAVSMTLRDRIKRLDVEIKNLEENAKIYATSAEDLAKFTRDAKIAEATYTVLIEQVKSQSLAAGFKPETFKVYEYATPPLMASSPQRNLILALGAVLGMFLGCIIALINSVLRGVYYTRSALISDANAELALNSKSIKRLSQKSTTMIKSIISKRRFLPLDEAELKLADKKLIFVSNSGGRPSASNAVHLLATQSAKSGRQIVLCDTTGQLEGKIKDLSKNQDDRLDFSNIDDNIKIVTGIKGGSFFTSPEFKSTIKDLMDQFDQVFICSNKTNSSLGLTALEEFTPSFVLIAGLRATRKLTIKKLKSDRTIDLLFYD